ncbi:hypothetical protein [Inquilinus limosus]|uniref:hypothetical protein n=1 Tax=Inquilinus limosus TaxID=171674 RepID=UPI000429C04A|nr:hypothetical protein [Inquilinus limosus]
MSDVRSRLEALERQANAAAERGFPYRGVWQKAEQYNRGDFTTCDGSMWFCCASTRDRPGSSDAWTLAVKRGQDGKDAGR